MTKAPQDYGRLATAVADMARELLQQPSVQTTLDSIATHAVTLVDGCDAAGIMTVRGGEVLTLAATNEAARVSDRMQGMLGEGPCHDATSHREHVYRIEDLSEHHTRWPRYAEWARKLHVGSTMGFLLFTNGRDNLGALNMYSSKRGAFDQASEHVGWVLASHAAVALHNARHVENLDTALTTSRRIGEAIGVVMSRYGLSEDAAFEKIRHTSQTRNIKIRELAATITTIGELPRVTTRCFAT